MVAADRPKSRGVLLADFIESQRVGLHSFIFYAVGALCLVMDGFDAQGIGFAAPAISEDWHVARASLAPVFAIGLFGMVLGSLFISPQADRFGRRPILIAATFFFGVCMLTTSYVQDINQLLWLRFLTGFGLGGVMPNVLALTSEYTPVRHRTLSVMIMGAGFTTGAAVAGISSAFLIPAFGWRSLFVAGGIAPLVIGTIMLRFLPESGGFLVVKGAAHRQVINTVAKIFPAVRHSQTGHFIVLEPARARTPVAHLFRAGRTGPTILLWIISFMNLLELYFLSQWLPTLLRTSDLPLRTALSASTLLQVGGIIGTVLLALLTRRVSLARILLVNFALAALAIATIGYTIVPAAVLLFYTVFAAGFGIIGGQPGVNALTADYYPTFVRSTGVGWAQGIGRVGSIVGPLAGGLLLKQKWGNGELFLLAAVPSLMAAAATALFQKSTARQALT